MKKLLHIGLLFCFAMTVAAQENRKVLKVYDWKDLATQIPNSQIVSMDGMSVLKMRVEDTHGHWTNFSLLTITNAAIIGKSPQVTCELKAEHPTNFLDVGLQFECHFPPLAMGGDEITNNNASFDFPMTQFNWKRREFVVLRNKAYGLPNQFELKIGLCGSGTIYLRPIKLLGTTENSNWWSQKQSNAIGGVVGIFGGLIGCLGGVMGWLTSRGKARNFVLGTFKVLLTLGLLFNGAGIVAVFFRQSYFVWLVFLLPGILLTWIFSVNLPLIRRRYDELEIRKMTSMDMGS